jgi:hypothetical protein
MFRHNAPRRAWTPVERQAAMFDLRGLAVCEWCEAEMLPRVHEDVRYYQCLCRKPVPALELEREAWHRFSQVNGSYAQTVPPDRRRDALRLALKRIRVGIAPFDVRFEWRK